MKPVSMRFQCFGPYVHEQLIDFTQLEKNGLFLICGETGSGKTTILDAMCYALYGKSSGGLRGDMPVMRCKQATAKQETFVEYTFQSGTHLYRFTRTVKPVKRKDTDFEIISKCRILSDGEFVPIPDVKDQLKAVNAKAEELIGLTYEQFRQVIILPQGQFENLLVSNSEDKEKILVTLFHAEKWQKMAVKMYELADRKRKILDQEKLRIEEKLNRYGCRTPEELLDAAELADMEVKQLFTQVRAAEADVTRLQNEQEKLLLENQEFELLNQLKKELDRILPQKEQFDREEKKLKQSDRADAITPIFQNYKTALTEKCREEDSLAGEKESLAEAEETLEAAIRRRLAHENDREQYEQNKFKTIRLENARSLYQTLKDKKQTSDAAASRLKTAQTAADEAQSCYENANSQWESAITAQRAAIEEHRQAQDLYLFGIGSTLAEKLREGEPCPVCGSCTHPSPAKPIEGRVTEAKLDKLAKAMDKANQQEDQSRKLRHQAETENRQAHQVLSEQQQTAAIAQAEYEQILSQRIETIETVKQLDEQVERLNRAILDFEAADTEVQKRANAADSGVRAAQAGVEKAQKNLEKAVQTFKIQKKNWEAALSAEGFENEQQYQASCIPAEEKIMRQTELIQFRTDLANAQEAYNAKKKQLDGRQQPDVAGAKKTLKESEDRRDGIKKQYFLKEKLQKDMAADGKTLKKSRDGYLTERVKNEDAILFAKRLRGDFGISLQRYVLGVMLTSITAEANRLLKTVYGGRYQLYRTNEAAGNTRKKGLELEVADQDGRRSVTTLSGGEKFLLSLSLAIGLSAVVQAQGSGVRLEAMFIDEGFGSLDRRSVDDALEVLQSIRRSSGLVGIISHVDRLAEIIPAKIEITKTKDGSWCRVCC